MDLDLDLDYLGSMCTAVLIGDPATPPTPTPAFGLIYEGAVGQPRWRHIFVTPLGGIKTSSVWAANSIHVRIYMRNRLERKRENARG
jgi:hypothetical protein